MVWLTKQGYYTYLTPTMGVFSNGVYRKLGGFHAVGKSDTIAIPPDPSQPILFIEYKSAKGVQSEQQKSFQRQLEKRGQVYLLIHSLKELQDVITNETRLMARSAS